MNETDVRKCIKNGHAWSSRGDNPEPTPTRDYTLDQLATYEWLHATKHEAQDALDKAKAEAEPLEWCEYNEGYHLTTEAFISFDDGKTWTTVTGKFIGVCYSERLGIRARYRNPLWLAKHGKAVESHETPVCETQGKEVVTDETQHSPSKPLSDAEFRSSSAE